MKNLIVAILILVSTALSCQKETLPVPEDANQACFDTRPVLRKVDALKGRVTYLGSENIWVIRYYVPGTIDSQWTGLVCNLPEKYQKAGIEVEFSGDYRSVLDEVKPQFGGEEMYYLFLTSIREISD